jgi:hypothetical protein
MGMPAFIHGFTAEPRPESPTHQAVFVVVQEDGHTLELQTIARELHRVTQHVVERRVNSELVRNQQDLCETPPFLPRDVRRGKRLHAQRNVAPGFLGAKERVLVLAVATLAVRGFLLSLSAAHN